MFERTELSVYLRQDFFQSESCNSDCVTTAYSICELSCVLTGTSGLQTFSSFRIPTDTNPHVATVSSVYRTLRDTKRKHQKIIPMHFSKDVDDSVTPVFWTRCLRAVRACSIHGHPSMVRP